jgi:hypothetical protein
MKTNIKRLAQFLFDNAEMLVKELSKTSHYRSVSIDLSMFKHKKPELKLSLSFYNEKTTHYCLYDDAICMERFEQLCKQANNESGFTSLPKLVKVRKTLN